MIAFTDLARAAFCPRQLYYVRRNASDADDVGAGGAETDDERDPRRPPPEARKRMDLAFRYRALPTASDDALRDRPIAVDPPTYRRNLEALADRDLWDRLVDPDRERAFLSGKDCRGIAHKVLRPAGGESDSGESVDEPPVPTIVSPGDPPETGVYEPQAVRAVAAAKALAWEAETEVPRALIEYPGHAVVREVRLTTRKKAAYRRALRTARSIDGPPPRLRGDQKCDACDYREECGTRTRSLASLLGL
ncbi:CRISPR-associated protein Cas4 [Haloparvum sedimenti]|uniref:CRISPR-associated protein Cas4 n=1 Tax=Haloparvum sedimenti TaxID=1678448 RepID=UPI00071E9D99|nr:Dna2/Cas4 domain-containing protein [Haloparvum sedimenti]